MGLLRLSRREAAFVIGVPLAWAVLLLFHPGGDGTSIYADLKDNVTAMLVVHVGMMVFVPLFAFAIFLLMRGIDSTAAQVARIALVVFVVLYVAWESLQGIANGLLADQANSLSAADQTVAADLIQDFAESPLVRDSGVLVVPASLALVVAMVALGIALRDVGAPRWSPFVLGFAGLLISAHPPPFGPTGLLLFVIAVILLLRAHAVPGVAARGIASGAAAAAAGGTFTRGERSFLIGVPLAWALVLLLHPTGEGEDFYPIVSEEVTTWLIVHISTMVFVPLMAGVVLLLLRGVEGAAATISRLALVIFAVVYMAWEVIIGIGTGVLVEQVSELSGGEQAIGVTLVEGLTDSGLVGVLENVGTGAWIVALCAAGIALVRTPGVPIAAPVLLVLSAIPTAWHVAPFGQAGLLLFIAAVIIVLRNGPASAPAGSRVAV